jgi:thioredoxin 1
MTLDREPTRVEIDKLPGAVLLEFGADWCPYCIALQPTVASLLRQYPGVRHIAIQDGPGQPLGRSFGVKLWPTFVLMRAGAMVLQLVRPAPQALEKAMQRSSAMISEEPGSPAT